MEKMTIKEAGRYANFLDSIKTQIINLSWSGMDSQLVKRVETHKKSEANKDAGDEIIEEEFEDIIDVELEVLVEILNDVVKEKIALANAINRAKREIEIKIDDKVKMDLDSSIEYAKLLREVSNGFYNQLAKRKDKKSKRKGTGYAFNVEGNQVPYVYDIEIEETLKYDRNIYIQKEKENKLLADKISQEIDKAMNSDIVKFEPKYNYLDSLEDIVTKKESK